MSGGGDNPFDVYAYKSRRTFLGNNKRKYLYTEYTPAQNHNLVILPSIKKEKPSTEVAVDESSYPLVQEPPKKKARKKRLTAAQRRRVWDAFHNNATEASCLLCGLEKISRSKNRAYEVCHIVPQKYHTEYDVHNPNNMVPGCSTCNSTMGTMNLLDWLYELGRFKVIPKLVMVLYHAYAHLDDGHIHIIARDDSFFDLADFALKFYDKPKGHGLVYKAQICSLLSTHHIKKLQEQEEQATKKIQQLGQAMQYISKNRVIE